MLDDSHTCASMQCVHVINGCTKDPEMTESNLGWRLVREIFLWLICVSFCGYLYEEISSRQFPSMCPLLRLSEVLLSRCQPWLYTSRSHDWTSLHFALLGDCKTLYDGLLGFLQSVQGSWVFCATQWRTPRTQEQRLCVFTHRLYLFWLEEKIKAWTGQQSLTGLIQIDRQSFRLMFVPVGSF